jgi:hypothetical protein
MLAGVTARGDDDHEQQAAGSPLPRASCTGGQGMSPNEQKTQQSPGFGFMRTPQPGHSKKNRHASIGISSVLR